MGDIDEDPVAIFHSQFTQNLQELLDSSPGSIVLLVPSVRDLISAHATFSQPELSAEFSGDPVRHKIIGFYNLS